jgi:hypothetical protein
MHSNSFLKPINRRQLLSILGVSAVAAPTLTYASTRHNLQQAIPPQPAVQSPKRIVVSF